MPSRKVEKRYQKILTENTSLLMVKDHHLLWGLRITILEKLSSKKLYSLLISAIDHQPTSQNVLIICFLILNYLRKRSTWLHVKQLLTVTCVASVIKLLTMCFIWEALSVWQDSISFVFFLSYWSWNNTPCFFKRSVAKILWNQLLFLFETDFDFLI